MKRFSMCLVGLLLFGAQNAYAEQWKMSLAVVPDRSPGGCVRSAGGSGVDATSVYTFDLNGDTLSGTARTGKLFTTKIGADGSINYAYKSPSGSRLTISGNVTARKLEIRNMDSACVYQLMPMAN